MASAPNDSATLVLMVIRPALLVGLAVTLFGIVALAAQYTPVLFDHDAEFVMLACAALASGSALAAYRDARRRPGVHARRAVIGAGIAAGVWVAATMYLRLIGGIGWPRPHVVVAVVIWVALAAVTGSAVGGARRLHFFLRVPAIAAIAVASALVLVVGSAKLNLQRSQLAGNEHCEESGAARYCFYSGYQPLVRKWARPVDAVIANVPSAARPARLRVRQSDDHVRRPSDVLAFPHLGWDDDGSATAEIALALDVANRLIGITTAAQADKCAAPAARSVVVWWLAAQVDDRARQQVVRMSRDDPFGDAVNGSDYAAPIVPDVTVAAALASQLLEREDDVVRAYLWSQWDVLVDPSTSPDVLVDHFQLDAVQDDDPLRCD